jgi:vitamin B12 transporter
MSIVSRRTLAASALVASATLAQAQSPPGADIVVTPTRTAQPIQRAGSAVTVITAEDIEKTSAKDLGEVLRLSPGLTLARNGGPGQFQAVRIRGGDARHTLVLLDGIRVNDPTSTGREFDFATLVPADIERIEVLRGPQSALYGSEAMGGVINIITKRGRGAPRATIAVEGGSYGTKETRASISGGDDRVDYSFGLSAVESAGFSSFGYRIPRLRYVAPWGFEPDSARRLGFTGRVGVNVADGVRLELGGSTSFNRAQFDVAFLPFPDTPSLATSELHNIYGKLIADSFGGKLRNTVTIFNTRANRAYENVSYFGPRAALITSRGDTSFIGERTGAEYQGDLNLGGFGLTTFGARVERETADSFSRAVLPVAGRELRTIAAEQTTRSLFALHQVSLGDRLHLSLGGRLDQVVSPDRQLSGIAGDSERTIDRFGTWRATAAYEIPETETKLRASAGTGAKAPSLFQLFSPSYGTPTLQSEHSWGVDAGIDQTLANGAIKLSATAFLNRYRNLIDFATGATLCPPATRPFGCYFNVARARTSGFELSGDVKLSPEAHLRITYTNLSAVDLSRRLDLARRPRHEGRVGLVLTPLEGLSVEPTVVLVGERFSGTNETDRLAPYARLDTYVNYKVNETFSVYARAENLTNTRYEEVRNFGTPGRSFYAGVRATW